MNPTMQQGGGGRGRAATTDGSGGMSLALLQFVHRLREAAIPVSMVEALDAIDSVEHVDLVQREHLREALAATLVKRAEHRGAFDSLFDVYFATRTTTPDSRPEDATTASKPDHQAVDGTGREEAPSTDLLEALLEALRGDDPNALRALAAVAVDRFGGIDQRRSASERYYLYRILRQLDLSQLLRLAVRADLEDSDDRTPLAERLALDEQLGRMDEFRRMIADEVRRRLVELRGAPEAADVFHDRAIEDVDFLTASPAELREMREAIRSLAQKLAARIARRRRVRRHGRLDVRRTVRRSLSAGGVPLDPAFRYPRASKPDLFVLADISGSVAEFARFTMTLLYAMSAEFSKVRLFVFVDGIDEVTNLMESETDLVPRNLLYRTDVIAGDGHSDYGNVFRRFGQTYGGAIDARSTVIITGDARNNFRDPGLAALDELREHSRKVYWLNPEPQADWNTSDSIMDLYGATCHGVFEARNLRQLAAFVYQIA
jgi:uncharacterized protein